MNPDKENLEKESEPESIKKLVREVIGETVENAVELTDILGGTSGPLVDAQGFVAEKETEEFIDRIDGEG